MSTKRPCAICRRWFLPDPRVGRRQRACGPECSAALHRRACKDWHRRNAAITREGRVLDRVDPPAAAPPATPSHDPTARLDWAAIDDLLGPNAATVLRHALQLLSQALRDEIRAQPTVSTELSGRLPRDSTRDERSAQVTGSTVKYGRLPPAPPRDETDLPPRPP